MGGRELCCKVVSCSISALHVYTIIHRQLSSGKGINQHSLRTKVAPLSRPG